MMRNLSRKRILRKEASNLPKESSSFVKSWNKDQVLPELFLISYSDQAHQLAPILRKRMGASPRQILPKMYISCKEARETHYWLRLLIETKMISEKQLADLLDESNQLVSILTSIVKKASNSSD